MAATIKETQILEVTLTDTTSDEYTFRIDNPRNDLQAIDVTSAFTPMINNNWWRSPKNYEAFSAIAKTEIVHTTVVRHAVGEE